MTNALPSPSQVINELHAGQLAKLHQYKMEGKEMLSFVIIRDLTETWRLRELVNVTPEDSTEFLLMRGRVSMLEDINMMIRLLLAPPKMTTNQKGESIIENTFSNTVMSIPKARL